VSSHSAPPASFYSFVVEKKRKTTGDGPTLVAVSSSKSAPTKPKNHTAKPVAKPIGRSNGPARSTVIERLGFNEPVAGSTEPQVAGDYGHRRDERLVLVENLRPGPYQYKSLPDDPNFDKFEPHSSIRLSYVSPVSRNPLHPNIRSAFPTDRGISHTTNLLTSCGGGTIFPPPSSTLQYAHSQISKDTRFQWMGSGSL